MRVRSSLVLAVVVAAAASAPLCAQPAPGPNELRAVSSTHTYVVPQSGTTALGFTANYTWNGGGTITAFSFRAKFIGHQNLPHRFQIYDQFNIASGGDQWSTCPPDNGADVVEISNGVEIRCSDVTGQFGAREKLISVRRIDGTVIPARSNLARLVFDIPNTTTTHTATLAVDSASFTGGAGTPISGSVQINVPNVSPVLAFSQAPGSTISFGAGDAGDPVGFTLTPTASGGSGSATVALGACNVPQGFTVNPASQTLAVGASAQPLALTCTIAPSAQSGTLNCPESSTRGNTNYSWPLSCPAALPGLYRSSPRPSAVVAAYGAIGDATARASIAVSNAGTGTLTINSCQLSTTAGFGLSRPTTIAPGASASIGIDCLFLPTPGARLTNALTCTTSDAGAQQVLYVVECVSPPLASAGVGGSPFNRLGSPTVDAGARVGTAVASAIGPDDEEIIVVGAPDGGADDAGRAYVYVRLRGAMAASDAKRWPSGAGDELGTRVAVLAPSYSRHHGKGIGNKFGTAVAVSPDGSAIAVGDSVAGVVSVYTKPAGGWSNLATLTPVNLAPPPSQGVVAGGFGEALRFDEAGALVVGAPTSDVGATVDAGAAFAFARTGNDWTPSGPALTPAAPKPGGAFGRAVEVEDGMLAIGAPGESGETGAIYTYGFASATASNATRVAPAGLVIGDKFGTSIEIAGGVVAVGAPGADTTIDGVASANSGSVSILVPVAGVLTLSGVLHPEPGAGQAAGTSIASNGDLILVGAPTANAGEGVAYAYKLGNTIGAVERADGFYENAIGESGDDFASALSMTARRAIIGAPRSDEGNDADEGRADPFVLDGIFRADSER